MQGSVTVHVAAPVETVWDLVTDVTRIGEFSPETFEAQWTTQPPGPAPGARFRGHVRRNGRGPVYWTDCRVVEYEPPRTFAFAVHVRSRRVNTWRYALTPSGDGVDVTESYRLSDGPLTRVYWAIAGRARARTNEAGMRQTLERMRAIAEAAAAG